MSSGGLFRASRGTAATGTRRRVRLAAAGVMLGGVPVALAGALHEPAGWAWSPLGIPVWIIATIALMRPFEPAPGEKFTLGASVAFFSALVLPGATAVALIVLAVLAARISQGRSVLSTAVNVTTVAAATAAASLVVNAGLHPRAAALALAGAAFVGMTLLGLGAMILASGGARTAAAFMRRESLPTATLVALGGIAALLWRLDPITVALLIAPLVSVELGLRAAARQRAMMTALEEAHETQRRFTEDAAHELRTPLTALIGNLDSVRREALDPLAADAVADAQRVATGLRRLTERLLSLSRSAAPSTAGTAGDLADAAREAVVRATPRAGVTVALVAPATVEVPVSAELLAAVAGDLVANATAYTERGRIEVRVEVVGDEARLAVSDTGVGIPHDEQARVFDCFFRGAGARALGAGSGLGLAIVRRVVEAHGGSVSLTSRIGEGTSVDVRLPLRPVSVGALVHEAGTGTE